MSRDRFDQFTPDARRVLALAQEEAQRLGRPSITTGHLLLGLLRLDQGLVPPVFQGAGLRPAPLRAAVATVDGSSDEVVGRVDITAEGREAIDGAVGIAERLQHRHIGPEHLLLALLAQDGDVALRALARLGIGRERLAQPMLLALQEAATE